MKIIEQGKLWSVQRTCKYCKSKLEIEEDDVNEYESYSWDGDRETYYGFECPYCEEINSLSPSVLPARVVEKAWVKKLKKEMSKDGKE